MTTTKHKNNDTTNQETSKKRRGAAAVQPLPVTTEEHSDDSAISVSTMSLGEGDSAGGGGALVVADSTDTVAAASGPAEVPDTADEQVPDTMVLVNPGWIPGSVMTRLRQIAMCADHFRHRQILGSVVTADVSWGGNDQSFMVYRNQKVLTVSFVARLIRVKYLNHDGEPERCQQIKFRFFREADAKNARTLVFGKSNPAQHSSKTIFWAGKRCSVWDEDSRYFKPQLFTSVWDGTTRMLAKSKMQRLDITDLSRGDAVTIECNIHRYRVPTPAKGNNHAPWVEWRAAFQLSSITRLWKGSPAAHAEVESDADTVEAETTDDEFEGL